MIHKTEVRVGNKIMFSDDSSIFEVSGIHEFGLDVVNDIEETYIEYDQFEPIPLTEELLLKCGFEYTDEEKEFLQLSVFRTFKLNADNSDNFSSVTFRINDTTIEITSIHQLQNIFFALTNQELKINL